MNGSFHQARRHQPRLEQPPPMSMPQLPHNIPRQKQRCHENVEVFWLGGRGAPRLRSGAVLPPRALS